MCDLNCVDGIESVGDGGEVINTAQESEKTTTAAVGNQIPAAKCGVLAS